MRQIAAWHFYCLEFARLPRSHCAAIDVFPQGTIYLRGVVGLAATLQGMHSLFCSGLRLKMEKPWKSSSAGLFIGAAQGVTGGVSRSDSPVS